MMFFKRHIVTEKDLVDAKKVAVYAENEYKEARHKNFNADNNKNTAEELVRFSILERAKHKEFVRSSREYEQLWSLYRKQKDL